MIYVLLVVLAAAVLLYALLFNHSGRPAQRGRSRLDRQLVAQRWETVQAMANSGGNGLRQAVSEADKLLDYALRQTGARGDTMGEWLKSSGRRFSDLDSVWRAHKLRNALAHEVGFDLVQSQAREALSDFERGLRDLGAL